jgi:tryptophan-rich sensory protein
MGGMRRPTGSRASWWIERWPGLVLSIGLVALVSLIGSSWTDTGDDSWYAQLEQSAWEPPDWLFGPVWGVLYLVMAVAAWLVARQGIRRRDVQVALGLYAVQLALNLAWTGVFFGLERPGWAVAEIVLLLVALIATLVAFCRVSRTAAALLVPYLLWVGYAASLTAGIAARN